MKKLFLALLIVVACMSINRIALANDPIGKLGRGFANVTTGWMDVFKEMEKEADDRGALGAVFIGPVKGLFKAVARTVIGAYEVVTFPLPTYNPIVEPEFVWQRQP